MQHKKVVLVYDHRMISVLMKYEMSGVRVPMDFSAPFYLRGIVLVIRGEISAMKTFSLHLESQIKICVSFYLDP